MKNGNIEEEEGLDQQEKKEYCEELLDYGGKIIFFSLLRLQSSS